MNRFFLRNRTVAIRVLLVALAAIVSTVSAQASLRSDPVGVLRLKLRGNSDTIVSLPLHRPTLVEARISERNGDTLTLDTTVPSLPSGGAYALVMSGALEGAVLPVTSKSGDTLTVAAASYDLDALAANNLVAIIPYWTLDTVFPGGENIHVSTDAADRKSEILCFSETTAGTNLSAAAVYFYFRGADSLAAGWYKTGSTVPRGNVRLPPNRYFIVRHRIDAPTELTHTGHLQLAGFRIPIGTRAANRAQDNLVAMPVPVPVPLATSGLLESGVFLPSPDGAARIDELLVFNNSTVGFNKSASRVYFYIQGNPDLLDGWYKAGDPTPINSNSILLAPGEGYVVRKPGGAIATTSHWAGIPFYLQ